MIPLWFFPEWLSQCSVFEVKKAFEKRCMEISERYRDRIPQFEVTNELLLNPVRKDPYPYSHSDAILSDAFKLAVSAAVSAKNPEYRCVIRIDRDYA